MVRLSLRRSNARTEQIAAGSCIRKMSLEGIEMVNCPNCDAVIDVDEDELDEGDTLTCDECGADLSVTGLDPLELETEEDEDGDEEEEEAVDYDEDEDEDEEEEEAEEEDWH